MKSVNEENMRQRRVTFAGSLPFNRLSNKPANRRMTLGTSNLGYLNEDERAASLVGSVASVDSKRKARSYPIWPEFTDNDINNEKWDGVKGKEKGKSPSLQFFEDPEGRLELPQSIIVDSWKRPQDFLNSKQPFLVENENYFDLVRGNGHLCHSEVMRTIISQINSLWTMRNTNKVPSSSSFLSKNPRSTPDLADDGNWKPWHHIYSLCKTGKDNVAQYNPYGKYIVRLFWMGCWRKIVVDDQLPFDDEGCLLLPSTTVEYELWPMILAKALIKVAAIDYDTGNTAKEIGDFFVIHCLTGWLPELIPLKYDHAKKVWNLLKKILPEWKLPEDKHSIVEGDQPEHSLISATSSKRLRNESSAQKPDHPVNSAHHKEKGSGKEGKTGKDSVKKREDKEKSKSSPHSARPISAAHSASGNKGLSEEVTLTIPENPEVVVFATFSPVSNSPAPMSIIKEMADASEKLRTVGLSHIQPHPVRIGQTRSCPLIPPTQVPEIPKWKLIRPMKKRVTPHDQPQREPVPPKPDQWLEISSPYIGHSVSPLTVDLSPLRPRSRVSVNAPLNEDGNDVTSKPREKGKSTNSTKSADVNSTKSQLNSSTHSPLSSMKDGDTSATPNNTDAVLQPEEVEGDEITLEKNTNLIKTTWINFEDFWKSFKTLVVFHKTTTYPHLASAVEFKQTTVPATNAPATNKKGSANVKENTSTTNIKPSVSPVAPKSYEGFPAEEKNPSFLFVDNLEESEIVVNFAVLPKWSGFEEKRISDRESVAGASEVASTKHDGVNAIPSGLLVAELYSWKTVVTGQPVLRIRTTGTRAACLTLPPGRHVLRFIFNSPLGHHIQICSSTKFVYGDEDTVMVPLQEESCRFVKVANGIMESLISCINSLGDREEYKKAMISLNKAHMSFKPKTKLDLLKHYKVWNSSFYRLMQSLMSENREPAFEFSCRALMFGGQFDHGAKGTENKDFSDQNDVPESWANRKATATESNAAHCIQKNWRGTYVRKLNRAVNIRESSEHLTVKEIMNNSLAIIQRNKQSYANQLLRYMIKDDPSLLFKYSLDTDEWNKICFVDYQGTFPDQNPKTWFVVFREVFYVEEDRFCVPKLYGAIPTCRLRIINNDNGEEIKTIFQKVSPHVYKKNQRGYTFIAEARTLEHPLPSGKWRMRLIGFNNPLPAPPSGQINALFTVKEIRDYYIPNMHHILLRYHVRTTLNHIASIQLETSKPDVHVKLQILDNNKEVISTRGKGHCVIPAFCFLTNNKQDGDQTSSKLSNQEKPPVLQGSKQSVQANSGKKRNSSAKSLKDGKNSPKSKGLVDLKPLDDPTFVPDDGTFSMHNYTIQVMVEQKSWPLSKSQWEFVQKLKDLESEELKAFSVHKDRIGSAANKGNDRQSGGGAKVGTADKSKKGAKGSDKGKEKKSHDKDTSSRPASQNAYDGSKAFWTLRFVSDMDKTDEVEIKKDVQRQDEIRAMKQAWEAADSGRAIKAMQSRFSYLKKNASKVKSADRENEEESKNEELDSITLEPDEEKLTWEPPSYPSKKYNVEKFDVTPFLRSLSNDKATFLEPTILAMMEENKQKEKGKAYAAKREISLEFQEENRHYRLSLKEQQLEIFQNLQYALDKARAELLQPRDIYRKSLLDEKKLRDIEKENQELVTSEPVSPDPKGKKSAGKKKK